MTNKHSLDSAACKKIAHYLSRVLADNYVLYTKTQNFHWNVIDPRFYQLHKLWEEQFEDLADANDLFAERMRMLQEKTPASLKEFLALTNLKESEGMLTGDQMLEELVHDHEFMIKNLHTGIPFATDLGDDGTADLFIQRLRAHEKMAWFLRSHLPKQKEGK